MLTKSEKNWIKSLNDRTKREQDSVFVAEGKKLVMEMVSQFPEACQLLILDESFRESATIKKLPVNRVEWIEKSHFSTISTLRNNHSALAVMKKPVFDNTELGFNEEFILYLDGLQDPGNMGTILRSADWFGLKRIYCSDDSVDIFNNKAVQASMSSVMRVQVLYTAWDSIKTRMPTTKVFLADAAGLSYNHLKSNEVQCICIGSEGNGAREQIIKDADQLISIPRATHSKAESLNAAIAASILLAWKFA